MDKQENIQPSDIPEESSSVLSQGDSDESIMVTRREFLKLAALAVLGYGASRILGNILPTQEVDTTQPPPKFFLFLPGILENQKTPETKRAPRLRGLR